MPMKREEEVSEHHGSAAEARVVRSGETLPVILTISYNSPGTERSAAEPRAVPREVSRPCYHECLLCL